MQTTKNAKVSESFENILTEKHKNIRYASRSLQESLLATDEPRLLNLTLQRIIKAHGGFSHVARITGIQREALYRSVALKSTPKIHIVFQILTALKIPFAFPAPVTKRAHDKKPVQSMKESALRKRVAQA